MKEKEMRKGRGRRDERREVIEDFVKGGRRRGREMRRKRG